VAACQAQQWFSFAYGIEPDSLHAALLSQLQSEFATSGGNIPALLLALTQTTRFTERPADPGVGTGATGTTGSGQAGSPDMGATTSPQPDMTPPPPKGNFSVQVATQSDWQTGYCATVTVTNNGQSAGNWTVSAPIEGLINNIWNATAMPMGTSGATTNITFVGVSFNDNLAPGANTAFGFCAQK
jgi:endoglucanase